MSRPRRVALAGLLALLATGHRIKVSYGKGRLEVSFRKEYRGW